MSAVLTPLYPHVTVDAEGVVRVSGTRLKVIHLVQAKQAWNLSPEELVEHFPPLTLAEAHAALTYYYDHQAELDARIQRDDEFAEQMRPLLDDGRLRAKAEAWRATRTPT
ncbi:MAG TPA: DUF433 domain-containing protein [Planctomycetaceae bacterium]|nr:DUF433 domain-containing protein [Planctomycetaceae bacterium]